ncbi:hypothetical protein ABPG73_001369 [Tetrahymena malaccensis]
MRFQSLKNISILASQLIIQISISASLFSIQYYLCFSSNDFLLDSLVSFFLSFCLNQNRLLLFKKLKYLDSRIGQFIVSKLLEILFLCGLLLQVCYETNACLLYSSLFKSSLYFQDKLKQFFLFENKFVINTNQNNVQLNINLMTLNAMANLCIDMQSPAKDRSIIIALSEKPTIKFGNDKKINNEFACLFVFL